MNNYPGTLITWNSQMVAGPSMKGRLPRGDGFESFIRHVQGVCLCVWYQYLVTLSIWAIKPWRISHSWQPTSTAITTDSAPASDATGTKWRPRRCVISRRRLADWCINIADETFKHAHTLCRTKPEGSICLSKQILPFSFVEQHALTSTGPQTEVPVQTIYHWFSKVTEFF